MKYVTAKSAIRLITLQWVPYIADSLAGSRDALLMFQANMRLYQP